MYCAAINRDSIWEHEGDVDRDVDIEAMTIVVKKNNTLFFYVLYPDNTCVFDQSEHVQGLNLSSLALAREKEFMYMYCNHWTSYI